MVWRWRVVFCRKLKVSSGPYGQSRFSRMAEAASDTTDKVGLPTHLLPRCYLMAPQNHCPSMPV